MAPSGVPILRPPAHGLPPGIEWQATQSAARATYSSLPREGPAFPTPRKALSCVADSTKVANIPPAHSRISPNIRTALGTLTSLSHCARIGLHQSTEIGVHDRQRTDALARSGEDRIRHRGG